METETDGDIWVGDLGILVDTSNGCKPRTSDQMNNTLQRTFSFSFLLFFFEEKYTKCRDKMHLPTLELLSGSR